jgi:hypothetical protein
MANRKIFYGMLALALVFGMVLIACSNDTTDEPDRWSPVSSLEQLNGTWKGSRSVTVDIADFLNAMGSSMGINISPDTISGMGEMLKDLKVKIEEETTMTMTVNTAQRTGAKITKMTLTFSGKNIDTMWSFISDNALEGGADGDDPDDYIPDNVTIDDKNHSMAFTEKKGPATIDDAEIEGILQSLEINQTERKIRILEDPTEVINMPEMTLTKQQ